MPHPGDIEDDHVRLLALARRAIVAESGRLWTTSPMEAVERHGAACDELWSELRRQIDLADGKVPVLELPSKQKQRLARRMRREIVAAVQGAVEEALEDLDLDGRQ